MTPSDSVTTFQAFSEADGVVLETATPRAGIEAMLKFLERIKAEGCDGPDGDMLLFQWGTYDWGSGSNFELNVTRQFIESDLEDDDAISQLSLTFRFPPSTLLDALGNGNLWCEGPRASDIARDQALEHPAFIAVADAQAQTVDLTHNYV